MLLLFISFIAGVLTVLAPCILPLLPIIIGSSITDGKNKHKPYVVIGSLIISIVVFTLVLKWSTAFISVPPYFWTTLSGIVIILVSLSMLFPGFWESLKFFNKIGIKSNKILGAGYKKESFWGDVLIGAALGPVFSSCSPIYFVILATVLPQSFLMGLADLFAYSLGLGLILLLISLLGQKIVSGLSVLSDPRGIFKKSLGAVFLVVGLFILSGLDKTVQTELVTRGFTGVTSIEEKLLRVLDEDEKKDQDDLNALEMKKDNLFPKYREIVKPGAFVNTGGLPIKISDYIGQKVILLDIMTYSCINCQRTFPYVNTWYEKYQDEGLIIIGIHTPEFAFERDIKNVEAAMKKFGVKFPIVLDNEYGTWNAYGNNYWPRKYLIDIDGYIVYDHIGEGEYDKTEEKIIELLKERAERLGTKLEVSEDILTQDKQNFKFPYFNRISPETYLGSTRVELDVSSVGSCVDGACKYNVQETIPQDRFGLIGLWNRQPEYVELVESVGAIKYRFNAKKVFLVAEASNAVIADIYLDGQKISKENSGEDVVDSQIIFKEARLYNLVNLEGDISEHILEIKIQSPYFKAYAFTFGY